MAATVFKILLGLSGLSLLVWMFDDEAKSLNLNTIEPEPRVTVLSVTPAVESPLVAVSGVIKARWSVDLSAGVSGQVVDPYEHIQPGTLIKKGQVIAEIDNTQFAAAMASAQSRIAQAQLDLQHYQHKNTVALRLENAKQGNAFRLFEPHIAAAKAELKAAQAQYQAALKNFNDTKIKAPFAARVFAKYIVPSQMVSEGQHLYRLASARAMDIEVNLSEQQWQHITTAERFNAQVYDLSGRSWPSDMHYLSPTLNPDTRQRKIMLTMAISPEGDQPFMPEQQVTVKFSGRTYTHAVRAPATVLTRDHKVWTVKENQLFLEPIQLIEESTTQALFTFVQHPASARKLVLYPLSHMLSGQSVQTQWATNEEVDR